MTKRNTGGVEVILDCLKDPATPRCPHGPTLLFERYGDRGKSGQRFYACSACRDRRGCSFFQHANAGVSKTAKLAREKHNLAQQPTYTQEECQKRLSTLKSLPNKDRKFCHTCNILLLPDEWSDHNVHIMRDCLSDADLSHPSEFLSPLENNKSNAQFLFSEETCTVLLNCIQELGFAEVLCIGTPRFHEAIAAFNSDRTQRLKSLLLDIDHRYMQFCKQEEFCRYNMFNHHFFDDEQSIKIFREFVEESTNILVVVDPPFGGLVEVLAHTLRTISTTRGELKDGAIVPTLLFFPYYLEHRISEYLPTFFMSDYRVNYTNHESYQSGSKGRKHGSPVRFFTNITLKRIHIPENLGYRWCDECEMSVHSNNKHCISCKSCTSKDGSAYRHCDMCERCVKPSRVHCSECNMCVLKDHECGQVIRTTCHICGEEGHKRRECPKRHEIWKNQRAAKRKHTGTEGVKKKFKVISKRRRKKFKSSQ